MNGINSSYCHLVLVLNKEMNLESTSEGKSLLKNILISNLPDPGCLSINIKSLTKSISGLNKSHKDRSHASMKSSRSQTGLARKNCSARKRETWMKSKRPLVVFE